MISRNKSWKYLMGRKEEGKPNQGCRATSLVPTEAKLESFSLGFSEEIWET